MKLRRTLGVIAVLLLAGAAIYFFTPSAKQPDPDSGSTQRETPSGITLMRNPRATLENFRQLRKGMTREQVRAILGENDKSYIEPGTMREQNEWLGDKGFIAVWFEETKVTIGTFYYWNFHTIPNYVPPKPETLPR